MKTIKVIDLLNKIAKGEELPKKIIYKNCIFENRNITDYWCNETSTCLDELIIMQDLNEEVEIIEDTPKEDKKIEKMDFCYEVADEMQNANNERFRDFINEIIDKVNGE